MYQCKEVAIALVALATSMNGATLLFQTNPLSGVANIGGQIVNGGGG
jgi:hypothetical protein